MGDTGHTSLQGTTAATRQVAQRMMSACLQFLESLDSYQRSRAVFPFHDQERFVWHYAPIDHKGVPFYVMNDQQKQRAHQLLASGLTDRGYALARAVIEHETILGKLEREEWTVRFDRDPGLYYFTVFGDPSGSGPWSWRVNGHHLFLHFTVVDGQVASPTPSFYGANPARVPRGPQAGLRILASREDLARELVRSLDPQRRARAVIADAAPRDIFSTNVARVELGPEQGLPAADMTPSQRDLLVRLVEDYITTKAPELAQQEEAKLQARGINRLHFAWMGSLEPGPGNPHYYRIQGPGFLIEFDNWQNNANHIHSVWRDVEGDFGMDLLRLHYQQHHR